MIRSSVRVTRPPRMSPPLLLGYNTQTREPVLLGDQERLAGTYVLGRPGTGKTTLLLNMALHDLRQDHGLFFLDPHGDAITDLLYHGDIDKLERDALLLDPTLEDYAFGINLTRCEQVQSLVSREQTYTKAYNIFRKAFAEEWGPWLQLIIQNTLYVFIENPEHTLAEAPRFLLDGDFRQKLVSRVTENREVADFWQYHFGARRQWDQEAQVDAALTRFSTFLGHPYVKHIIGQTETTIDFARLIRDKKVILLR